MTERAPVEYVGELVRVQGSDHADMPDALVVWIAAPADDIAPLTFEIARDEARELIAGLAALL
jgi:hypothetical protein